VTPEELAELGRRQARGEDIRPAEDRIAEVDPWDVLSPDWKFLLMLAVLGSSDLRRDHGDNRA
jgi:hypothetical protein